MFDDQRQHMMNRPMSGDKTTKANHGEQKSHASVIYGTCNEEIIMGFNPTLDSRHFALVLTWCFLVERIAEHAYHFRGGVRASGGM